MMGSKEMVEEDYERIAETDNIYLVEAEEEMNQRFWQEYRLQEGEVRTDLKITIKEEEKLPF